MTAGHRTYRLEGVRIEATPWVIPHMDEDTVRSMVAELLIADIAGAAIAAEGQRGPFVARLLDFRGRGATPLAALRDAVDAQQRAKRMRARVMP